MLDVVNIGFGNIAMTSRIIAIVTPDSAPLKRLVSEARESKKLIDATFGRRTRSVLVMDNNFVILSAITPETIMVRALDEEGMATKLEKMYSRSQTKQEEEPID